MTTDDAARAILTFVVPVRHPDNARDWPARQRYLHQTVRSIAGQTDEPWRGLVAPNHGADLPDILEREGSPLERLPFAGAVYRIGHRGSFMGTTGVFRRVFNRGGRPRAFTRRLARLDVLSGDMRREVFGVDAG